MAQEPRGADAMGISLRPQPWLLDPSNGSALPAATNASYTTESANGYWFLFNFKNIAYLVTVLISLCGLVGNGTVIWLLGFRVKRNAFSVYILNLASADFSFLLWQSVLITQLLLAPHSYLLLLMVINLALMFMSYLAGLSLLMAISIERCIAVLFPIWYKCHRPTNLSSIVCALIWALSHCVILLVIFYNLSVDIIYVRIDVIGPVMVLLTFLVLCVCSLTLVIRVQCCSWRRQPTRLYKVTLLTVLTFLVLGLPLAVSFLVEYVSFPFSNYDILVPLFFILSALNSGANPIIYFFVGRQRHQRGRKPLSEVLQSAMTDDM